MSEVIIMINLASPLRIFNETNVKLAGFAMLAQADQSAIERQPSFELLGNSMADDVINDLNKGLDNLKKHDKYWDSISHKLISLLDDLNNFYTGYKSIIPGPPDNSSTDQWLGYFKFLHSQILRGKEKSEKCCVEFKDILKKMKKTEQLFLSQVNKFNAAVNGTEGVLFKLSQTAGDLYIEILYGSIAVVFGGLIHGIFDYSIINGYLRKGVLPGRNLVIALVIGAALLGTIIYRLVTCVSDLQKFSDQKSTLKDEVKRAMLFSNDLQAKVLKLEKVNAVADKLNNTWHLMNSNISNLIGGLENKTISTEQARTIFMAGADQVNKGFKDIQNYRSSLSGIRVIKGKTNESILDTVSKIEQSIIA